jgi:predicted ATPase
MKNKKIIISGPPGSGKTSIINKLKNLGYLCFSEVTPPKLDLSKSKNKLKLSEYLFEQRIHQYYSNNIKLSFYDRSIIDVVAYMNYWKMEYPNKWDKQINDLQYSKKVFYTPSWKSIYIQSEVRQETFSEATKIDIFLRQAYHSFNYEIIELPKKNIDHRVNFIINSL